MSYKIRLKKKDRIAARFLMQLHSALAKAAIEAKKETGLTQKKIAEELGVDRAFISRILKGQGNPTARTIAELSAAMGYKPEIVLHKISAQPGSNEAVVTYLGNTSLVSPQDRKTANSSVPMFSWSAHQHPPQPASASA